MILQRNGRAKNRHICIANGLYLTIALDDGIYSGEQHVESLN